MLNEYLGEAELQSSLREFLEKYNFMFSQIMPDREVSVFKDKKLLAKLHHSLNLDKYRQRSFRYKLLLGAPDDKIVDFAKKLGMDDVTYEESRTEAFRAKLARFKWSNNDQTKIFVEVFGYPSHLIPADDDVVEASTNIAPSTDPFNQMKDYQSRIMFRAFDFVKQPNSRFLIHMPTGSGKTRVAMEIISHFLNDKEGRQVVWLADRKELCEQAMDAFIRVWSHLGRYPITVHRIWGSASVPERMGGTTFAVAMYQKIRGSLSKLKADLIVPDEAHMAVAPTYSKIIEGLRERRTRQTRVMGLTATPGRGSGVIEENEKLSAFFNRNIIGIGDGNDTIESLQKKGILARCERDVLNPNIEYSLTQDEWEKISKDYNNEFPDGLLEKIANDQRRNLKILLKLRDMDQTYHRIMVFCGSVEQSKLMASFMDACGSPSAYVDGSSPTAYRTDVVKKFRNGDIRFLFNYDVFKAGFDVPKIDAVVIIRPTTSVVLYGQMIGRGMRGPVMGGTTAFTLVDVVDNIITEYGALDNVHEYFDEYWE